MFDEWLCILVHDWGYWGCPNMDGPEGKRHPELGAMIACQLVYWWFRLKMLFWKRGRIKSPHLIALIYASEAYDRTLYHSSHYARIMRARPSVLYLPDKASILFESRWWYLLRARLSGEVHEYIVNSPLAKLPPELRTPSAWYNWYRRKVKEKMSK